MDGSHAEDIITDKIIFPTSLNIYEKRLYWTDFFHLTIESADIRGHAAVDRKILLKATTAIAFTIHNNILYW